jgi:hypothetical protein
MTIEHAPSTNGRAAQAQQQYDEQQRANARKTPAAATVPARSRSRLVRLVMPALLALAVVATFRLLEQRAGKS